MSIPAFILAFLTAVASYLLVSLWMDRRVRVASLRRFTGKELALAAVRHGAEPVLMQISDAVRGRMARGLLERFNLKKPAERMLETAGLKWGAAGLLHRSVGVFLGAFTLVTVFTHNRQIGRA